MAWQLKTKIETQGDEEDIFTPDGVQILVGSSQDQVLIYQEAFNDWTLKTKIAA